MTMGKVLSIFKNLLLVVVALFLYVILQPISFVYVTSIKQKISLNRIQGYLLNTAVNMDRFGNYEFRSLLNKLLIQKDGYQFGNFDETISSVIGKNKVANTLSKLGIKLDMILEFLDKNHSVKSIKIFEK